ncbi:hypothetical protein BCR35DRAFT_335012 [Leucosporidium creatinivorum]|uniref:Uncharacterized protein n=1 Tax=Leucosporidium creatinivorum TaxID=106004 RepID=A0A1Y2DMA8_9BASI|nr:hypothetical protein BCR35DRAFT_335012 [Leucosporidium creatinivorum]
MGAAIPLALSLAMAIRDALPGGAASSGGVGAGRDVMEMKVTIGTVSVADEVELDDEDSDIHLQTRPKSTITIELSLPPALAQAIVAGGGVLPAAGGMESGAEVPGGGEVDWARRRKRRRQRERAWEGSAVK